jgi:hypothetical protein
MKMLPLDHFPEPSQGPGLTVPHPLPGGRLQSSLGPKGRKLGPV